MLAQRLTNYSLRFPWSPASAALTEMWAHRLTPLFCGVCSYFPATQADRLGSVVAAGADGPAKSEIFTFWPFTENKFADL